MNSYDKYMIFLSKENAQKFEKKFPLEIEDSFKISNLIKTKKCKKRKIPGLNY